MYIFNTKSEKWPPKKKFGEGLDGLGYFFFKKKT